MARTPSERSVTTAGGATKVQHHDVNLRNNATPDAQESPYTQGHMSRQFDTGTDMDIIADRAITSIRGGGLTIRITDDRVRQEDREPASTTLPGPSLTVE